MRPIEEILDDIVQAKREKKKAKKMFGKWSYEHVEARNELLSLKEELEFTEIYS